LHSTVIGSRHNRERLVRRHGPIALLALVLFGQAIALGANTSALAAMASFAEVVVAASLTAWILDETDAAFWRALRLPAALFAAALIWAAAPVVRMLAPGLSGWPQAVSPDGVWLELTKLCGVAGIFGAGALIARSEARRRAIVNWLLIGALLYAVLAQIIWSANPKTVWGASSGLQAPRFTATLLNGNVTACFFGVFALIAAARIASAAVSWRTLLRKPVRAARAGLAALMLIAAIWLILRTASRTGLFGLGVGLLVLIALLPGKPGRIRWAPILAACGVTAAIVIAVVSGAAATFDRPIISEDTHSRFAAYQMHLPLAARSIWFGYGLGSFRQLHEHALTLDTAVELWDLGAVHQALLQPVIEGGLPFAALLVATIISLLRPVLAAMVRRKDGRRWTLGFIGALVVIAVDSADDIALNVPVIAALFALALGLLWGWAHAPEESAASV